MGTSYILFRLDAEIAEWLREVGEPPGSPPPRSRLPTLAELKAAIGSLPGYTAEWDRSGAGDSVDSEVVDDRGYQEGWSTTLWVKRADQANLAPAEGDQVCCTFHKGSPELAVMIVEALTHVCGPLVLVEASGAVPLIVTPGTDPARAVASWLE